MAYYTVIPTAAIAAIAAVLTQSTVLHAAELTPGDETTLIHNYCGSCHSDKLMYGGMSLEHFDAARLDPSLAAMLLSKITSSHTPAEVAAATPSQILQMMKTGAINAAGKARPDEPTQVALSTALARQSKGAGDWNVLQDEQTVIASILREHPAGKPLPEGATISYRLVVTCREATGQGEIKLSWADASPDEGRMSSISVDGAPPFEYKIEGGKAQGSVVGPGAVVLKIGLPDKSLVFADAFPGGRVEFPFNELNASARHDLSACFPKTQAGRL